MLMFKKLELSDIKIIKPYFSLSQNRACDNTVGGTFIWRDFFCMEYAVYKQNFIFKGKFNIDDKNIIVFAMPLGKNIDDITESFRQIELYCKKNKIPMILCLATEEDIKIIEKIYKNTKKSEEIGWSDYLYKAIDLANLAGRKYSGQRNHINYFKRTFFNYNIKQINSETIGDTLVFFEKYKNTHDKNTPALIEETKKVFEILENIANFKNYSQTGIALYIENSVIGFAIGEIINDTLFVHIEKADSEYRGAYQILVNEFAKQNADKNNILYINREDDAGDENLRISKMSYHPCEIIKKYTVEIEI
ncbi:MAG: phosphatidylglycerol lysyltransferase domain-containing protein [Oscillospiraceae bacterium]|nr:phosphatidylglycerol lysyltransferase domain-containing protein [Oscillospiraceae bacterium]